MHCIHHGGYCIDLVTGWQKQTSALFWRSLCTSLKTSQGKKNGLLFQLTPPAFIPQNTYYPFVIIKPLFLRHGNFFESVFIPGHAPGVYIIKNANKLKLKKLDTCYCCLGKKKTNNKTNQTNRKPQTNLCFLCTFWFQETLEYKMVFCFYEPFILTLLRLPNQVTFARV